MRRSELKQLIKECLIEVLQEGLGPISGRQQPALTRSPLSDSGSRPSLRSAVGRQAAGRQSRSYDPRLDERVGSKPVTNLLTNNPVMASIFEDTASTTLMEQDESVGGGYTPSGGDAAGMTVAQHAPEEMFDGADRWSALAFSKPPRKTSDAPVHASPSAGSAFSVDDDDDDPFAGIK